MTNPFTLQFMATASDQGLLLRDYLLQKQISKTALTDIKSNGNILVNQQQETVRYIVQTGDHILVQYPPEQGNSELIAENIPLQIQYEDDTLLLLEKPALMHTIPSRLHPSGTLANALLHYYTQTEQPAAVHFVTRLDFGTSGLVLVAKHRHIHHQLSLAQQNGAISKKYLALVAGQIQPPEGTITLPIARTNKNSIQRMIHPDGQHACTLYRTCQTFSLDAAPHSLLELQLLTGRTHQIRVHMAAINHPLLGDALYGGDCHRIHRQALHCASLQFHHPVTQESMQFFSSLPHDLQQWIPKTQ